MTPMCPWGDGIFVDANGSLRVDTDAYGNPKCWADYYAFAEPACTGCSGENYQFAGLYSDPYSEDGGHSAAHRRYNDTYYRWLSPDPGGRKVVKIDDPQTWNMYAYVGNNPSSLNDPSGLCAGGPAGWATAGYCGLHVDPWGNGAGAVVGGYDIFDALEGAPGTNLTLDLSGYPGFGFSFSENQWVQYWANSEMEFRNSPAYINGLNNQLQAVIAALRDAKADNEKIKAFIKLNMRDFWKIGFEGGNFDFEGKSLFANLYAKCGQGRCDRGGLGTLDFSHKGGTFHLDTADPLTDTWSAIVHFGVDVLFGHMGSTIIPRPWQ